jgi:hypothetical protein
MLKKTIKYQDFDGTPHEEDFYFNLTKAEVLEMELSQKGGLVESINEMVKAENGEAIMQIFKKIILKAYGQKSPDGKHFRKDEQASLEFSWTGAYDELFVELVTNPDAAAAFVNGIVPQATPQSN